VSTGAVVALVVGVGGAVFLYTRSRSQQQQALAAAAAAAPPPPPGGITGFATGLFNQWKGDPLGIKNAMSLANTGKTVTKSAASTVTSLVGGIKGIF
jgi:hypothetical protein